MTSEKKIEPEGKAIEENTWFEDLGLDKLDTDFPLSGGETEEDLEHVMDAEGEKTSFFDDLETEFPLSGGEVER